MTARTALAQAILPGMVADLQRRRLGARMRFLQARLARRENVRLLIRYPHLIWARRWRDSREARIAKRYLCRYHTDPEVRELVRDQRARLQGAIVWGPRGHERQQPWDQAYEGHLSDERQRARDAWDELEEGTRMGEGDGGQAQ